MKLPRDKHITINKCRISMSTWNKVLSKTTSYSMYRVFMPWATLDGWRSAVLCPYLADETHHLDGIVMPPLYASWCSDAKCRGFLVLWIYPPCIGIQQMCLWSTLSPIACMLSLSVRHECHWWHSLHCFCWHHPLPNHPNIKSTLQPFGATIDIPGRVLPFGWAWMLLQVPWILPTR